MDLTALGDLTSQFSISVLIAGVLFSSIGLWVFGHGKKNQNLTLVIIGCILFVYPYFVSSKLASWGIGIVLCGAAYQYWE